MECLWSAVEMEVAVRTPPNGSHRHRDDGDRSEELWLAKYLGVFRSFTNPIIQSSAAIGCWLVRQMGRAIAGEVVCT